MTMPAKQVQREARREAKAETAALLEKVILIFSSCFFFLFVDRKDVLETIGSEIPRSVERLLFAVSVVDHDGSVYLGMQNIEKELLQRLQTGTYGDIYNFPVKEYEKVLAMEEMEAADEEEEVIFPNLILLKTLEQSFYMLSQ